MKINRVELREIQMPLVNFFETSFGRTTTRRIVLVRVDAEGLEDGAKSPQEKSRSTVMKLPKLPGMSCGISSFLGY